MHDKENNGTSNGHGTGLRLQQASLRMRRSRKTHIQVATTREACKPRIQASPLRSKPDTKQSHGSGSAHKAAMTLNITSLAKGLQQQRRTHNKHKLETQCTTHCGARAMALASARLQRNNEAGQGPRQASFHRWEKGRCSLSTSLNSRRQVRSCFSHCLHLAGIDLTRTTRA